MESGLRGSTRSDDQHGVGSRRPGWEWIKDYYLFFVMAALFGCLVWLDGCAGSTYTYIDANSNPVTVKSEWYGSGCVAYDVDAKGNPRLIHSVDAETNWITGRIVPPLVGLAGALWFRTPGMLTDTPGPSGIGGCRFLFLDQGEDDDPDEE